MNKTDLISIRDGRPEDHNFIYASWLKGLLYGGDELYRKVPQAVYFLNHHRVIEGILVSKATKVKVAVLKEDPDVILGYAVYREAGGQIVLDFVFVKKSWRNIGIAKSICPSQIYAVSSLTRVGSSILKKHPQVIFNPYI